MEPNVIETVETTDVTLSKTLVESLRQAMEEIKKKGLINSGLPKGAL